MKRLWAYFNGDDAPAVCFSRYLRWHNHWFAYEQNWHDHRIANRHHHRIQNRYDCWNSSGNHCVQAHKLDQLPLARHLGDGLNPPVCTIFVSQPAR